MKLQPHQERVVEEESALAGNVERLDSFVDEEICRGLDIDEQVRLRTQLVYMAAYLDILRERIAAW